jgi:hypothetical protein
MNITVEQNNALVNLSKNNIPFIITGRYSYQSDVEPSDVDLIILKKHAASVDKIIERDDDKKNEGSKIDPEFNDQRVFYKNKIDILYIDSEIHWEELICFSRVKEGIRYSHPAHSMLAKFKMIMKNVSYKSASSFKHGKDLEEYIMNTLSTE